MVLLIEITGEHVKNIMNALLKGDAFDKFQVRGVEISAITRFEISGSLDRKFMDEDRDKDRKYCSWGELKRFVFEVVKGGKKPGLIKIIFSLPEAETTDFHENAAALFLNLVFTEEKLNFTAATGQKNFSMDKSLDLRWEEYILNFFQANHWPAGI